MRRYEVEGNEQRTRQTPAVLLATKVRSSIRHFQKPWPRGIYSVARLRYIACKGAPGPMRLQTQPSSPRLDEADAIV